MTLIEMMISVTVGTIIIGVALTLFEYSARTFAAVGNYDKFNEQSRNTLDVMLADIRQAKHLTGYVSNSTLQQLTFTNMPGSAVSSFSYSYTNGSLVRTWGTQSTVLLTNITSLAFTLSQRNPSPTTNFTFYSASAPAVTKLINVVWICSLPVYGTQVTNTESIQTANIVVRN